MLLAASVQYVCSNIHKQSIKLVINIMFKIKITMFFTSCASFFWLPTPIPNPQNVVLVFFLLRITTTWRSIAKVPPEPTREAAKNAKRGNMKKISRAAFFGKKNTGIFQKPGEDTRFGGCTNIWMFMFFFSHSESLDDDPLRNGIAFGGPALFSKKGDSTSEREMYVQNDEK